MFERILCPVDLSPNSQGSIELASSIAKEYGAKLTFIYIAPQWLPTETIADSDYIRAALEYDEQAFKKVEPTETGIDCEHIFQQGNPGPEIVAASENFDLVVMSTHGHTGFLRLLMGSVAEYVLRHVSCPVLTCKVVEKKKKESESQAPDKTETPAPVSTVDSEDTEQVAPTDPSADPAPAPDVKTPQKFVTESMHHVRPIHEFDSMETVIDELKRAGEDAVPVINAHGSCHGILTRSDINHYRELKERLDDRDESVLDEVFETDEYGQRRPTTSDFEKVERHMTTGVVTIDNTATCQEAAELLARHPRIHHLVVVDHTNHPVGVLDSRRDLVEAGV